MKLRALLLGSVLAFAGAPASADLIYIPCAKWKPIIPQDLILQAYGETSGLDAIWIWQFRVKVKMYSPFLEESFWSAWAEVIPNTTVFKWKNHPQGCPYWPDYIWSAVLEADIVGQQEHQVFESGTMDGWYVCTL